MAETKSVTRCLNDLKLLDKRISKAIKNSQFANYTVGGNSELDKFSPAEDLQSVNDLINQRSKIKTGIMKSNSSTIVKIGDTEMTVVEAIETKDSIKYKKDLLSKMINDLNSVEVRVANINEDVTERLDRFLEANFGKDLKTNSSEYSVLVKQFNMNNKAETVDSLVYFEIAKKLEEEIDTFESEVDLVLSESNAVTQVEL